LRGWSIPRDKRITEEGPQYCTACPLTESIKKETGGFSRPPLFISCYADLLTGLLSVSSKDGCLDDSDLFADH